MDRARRKRTLKHGGGRKRVGLDDVELTVDAPPDDDLFALDEALEKLAHKGKPKADLVKLLTAFVLWCIMLKQSYRHVRRIGFLGWVAVILVNIGPNLSVNAAIRNVIDPYWVPGRDMAPTISAGDRLFVNKISFRFREPERGDIIVFLYPLRRIVCPACGLTDEFLPDEVPQRCPTCGFLRIKLQDPKHFIKRLVGLPGVKIRIDPPNLTCG